MPEKTTPTAATVGAGNGEMGGRLIHSHSSIPNSNPQEGNFTVQGLADMAILASDNGHEPSNEPTPRFRLLPADELDTLPPLRWLVEGEIPEASFAVLYGATGSGKSFVALDYAFRIAQQRPVVYIAAEGAHGYAARKLAWCKHHKQPAGHLYFITVPPNLLNTGEVGEIIAAVATIQPALVVVDTLARTMIGGDENTQRDMGLFVAACDRIRLATGGTVLVIHHTGRNGDHERGSTVLRGASDQVLKLENDDDLIRLSCEKSKDSSGFPMRAMRLVTVETGRQLETGEPETSCVVLPSDMVIMAGTLTKAGRTILETLAFEVFQTPGARAKQLMETTGIGNSTFYRTASQLVKDGLVRQDAKGDPFYITAEGLNRLAVK